MADERNFRSYYYSKVGFPSVEEKKSLEILFKANEVDDVKLSQFCLRFPLPNVYRILTWKVLLKILPRFQSNHEYVWKVKCEIFTECHLAVLIMQLATIHTPPSVRFLKMYLIAEECLLRNHVEQERDFVWKHFVTIAEIFVSLCPEEVEAYWLTRNFFNLLKKSYEHIPSLIESFQQVLKKEDSQLFDHLEAISAWTSLPVATWFCRGFAGVLPVACLVRVWDRVIGGSIRVLPYVGVALLMGLRRPLHAAVDVNQVLQAIENMSEETAEVITNKAIDVWQKYGSQLGLRN